MNDNIDALLVDEFSGRDSESIRRAISRWASAVGPGCLHPGVRLASWCSAETWCSACAVARDIVAVWDHWPTCMCCGRHLGDDRVTDWATLPGLDIEHAERLAMETDHPELAGAFASDLRIHHALCPACADELLHLNDEGGTR